MGIEIRETTDTMILAKLNEQVQEMHCQYEPNIFKPHNVEDIANLFKAYLNDKHIKAFIAYYDEIPVGYIMIQHKIYEENALRYYYETMCIEQICVEDKYRGLKIGETLIDFVKVYAHRHNVSRIEMNYWKENNNSGEFFSSQGFETYNIQMACKI